VSRTNGSGSHVGPGGGRGRRIAVIVGAAALLLVAFGGGYLLARGGDGSDESASSSPSVAPSQPATITPSSSDEPSASAVPSATAAASASSSPAPIEDGRHFTFVKRATAQGTWSITFDLAYFLTGQDAVDECGPDVPNDYCIVNDNPRLRTVPVARSVVVRYIPEHGCCALKPWSFPAFAQAVSTASPTEYIALVPWWITVQDGSVIRIEQQYLP
jgi:hypothetical protein